MSELTRYAVWDQSDHVEDVDGEWVRASEAEAEITRLKAELESTKRGHSVQREALRKQLTQEREDRGGQEPPTPLAIKAADALADAEDRHAAAAEYGAAISTAQGVTQALADYRATQATKGDETP